MTLPSQLQEHVLRFLLQPELTFECRTCPCKTPRSCHGWSPGDLIAVFNDAARQAKTAACVHREWREVAERALGQLPKQFFKQVLWLPPSPAQLSEYAATVWEFSQSSMGHEMLNSHELAGLFRLPWTVMLTSAKLHGDRAALESLIGRAAAVIQDLFSNIPGLAINPAPSKAQQCSDGSVSVEFLREPQVHADPAMQLEPVGELSDLRNILYGGVRAVDFPNMFQKRCASGLLFESYGHRYGTCEVERRVISCNGDEAARDVEECLSIQYTVVGKLALPSAAMLEFDFHVHPFHKTTSSSRRGVHGSQRLEFGAKTQITQLAHKSRSRSPRRAPPIPVTAMDSA